MAPHVGLVQTGVCGKPHSHHIQLHQSVLATTIHANTAQAKLRCCAAKVEQGSAFVGSAWHPPHTRLHDIKNRLLCY